MSAFKKKRTVITLLRSLAKQTKSVLEQVLEQHRKRDAKDIMNI